MTDHYHSVHTHRVRFSDVDREGVVFYGTYVTYQDEAFNALLREISYDYDRIVDAGWGLRVVETEMTYHNGATAGDRLHGAIRVDAIGTSSIDTSCELRRAADGTVLATGSATRVAVDASGNETVRVPDAFRDAVVNFQDDPPEPV